MDLFNNYHVPALVAMQQTCFAIPRLQTGSRKLHISVHVVKRLRPPLVK